MDVLIFALAATYVLGGMGIAANNPSVNIFNPRIVFWPLHFVLQGIRCYIPGEIGRNLRRGLRGLDPTPPTPKMKNSEPTLTRHLLQVLDNLSPENHDNDARNLLAALDPRSNDTEERVLRERTSVKLTADAAGRLVLIDEAFSDPQDAVIPQDSTTLARVQTNTNFITAAAADQRENSVVRFKHASVGHLVKLWPVARDGVGITTCGQGFLLEKDATVHKRGHMATCRKCRNTEDLDASFSNVGL